MSRPDKSDITYRRQNEAVDGGLRSHVTGVGVAVVAGTLAALVLGSKDLLAWVNNLPIGPFSDFLLLVAQDWQDMMIHARVTGFADTLHKLLAILQSLH